MQRENKLYDELQVGDTASVKRTCTANDLYVFAHASGNLNPLHLPDRNGDERSHEAVAPSMWIGALISSVLGNVLPGPGTLYRAQNLAFHNRVHVGDQLTIVVTARDKKDDGVVVFDTIVTGPDDTPVAEGSADVIAPTRKVFIEDDELPNLTVQRHHHFDDLLKNCEGLEPLVTAVVAPEERSALGGALLAAQHNIIRPVLVGAEKKIRDTAAELGENLGDIEIVDFEDHAAAASHSVHLAHTGQVGALMKGHLHTTDLLQHVVKRNGGLRTSRRLSHVFVMDVPTLKDLMIVTDAAINIAPDLEAKVDIVQNAIEVALTLGVEEPRVGVLSAIETVNPRLPSTIDAAVLSKMAERGQITGGLVDGPLAMDNAIDAEAAKTKGITSLVAGRANILVVPNLESGNMLAKELAFVAHAEAAGLAIGASVPIILTSRSDGERARLASCAIAALYHSKIAKPAPTPMLSVDR